MISRCCWLCGHVHALSTRKSDVNPQRKQAMTACVGASRTCVCALHEKDSWQPSAQACHGCLCWATKARCGCGPCQAFRPQAVVCHGGMAAPWRDLSCWALSPCLSDPRSCPILSLQHLSQLQERARCAQGYVGPNPLPLMLKQAGVWVCRSPSAKSHVLWNYSSSGSAK